MTRCLAVCGLLVIGVASVVAPGAAKPKARAIARDRAVIHPEPVRLLVLPPLDTSPAPTMSQGLSPALSTTTTVATPPAVHIDATTPITSAPVEQVPPVTYARTTPVDTGGVASVLLCIAGYESGNDPATDTGNGFSGAWQDTQDTWDAAGGLAYAPAPYLASEADQLAVNEVVQAQQGWGAWPETSAMCGA